MTLHRHYKNKPYKYLGIAKHSETLEDLVIYQCLYDNPSAKIWVRPKEMFFENVEVDGQTVPRFAKVPLQIESFSEITEASVEQIAPIIEKVFGEWDPEWFHSRLCNHTRFHLSMAYIDEKPVGFKLGYEENTWSFHSWLGAVLPEYRGVGIASALMESQHNWCREQGYRKVQTKSQNRFREMLMLNLKAGFDIIGTHTSDDGGLKIILEKKL